MQRMGKRETVDPLKVITHPQIEPVRCFGLKAGPRDGEPTILRFAPTIEEVSTKGDLGVLGDIPDSVGLKDARRILKIIDGGKKDVE